MGLDRAALLLLSCALLLAPACGRPGPLRLATTTSVHDSGLLDALLPAFRERTGIDVAAVPVGTGMALRLGARGEADVLVTHDRAREEAFVREGHALGRRVFARSDFVVAGPPADPAQVRGSGALEGLRRIAARGALFASRGDESGTHARERELWRAAGVELADSAYVEVGAGMQTTLQFADERNAYTLTDRATLLAHAERLGLEALIRGDSLLANDYAVMVVDPRRHPGADDERARVFADWLASQEARRIIRGLRRGGERLFEVPGAGTAAQGSLTVSAAVSLKEALEEVVAGFVLAHPGTEVDLNLGASGTLRRQIEAGAPVDVLISAAAGEVEALAERGAVAPGTAREVACNALVVIVPPGAGPPLGGLDDLRGLRRIAVGAPGTVPAGEYARQALEAAGLRRDLEDRLVLAENVRQALEYVARGEADAAFVYRTDALAHPARVRLAFHVDPRLHAPVAYVAAAVAASPRAGQARRFLAWLSGAEARGALRRHGFVPPSCTAAAHPRREP